MRNRKPIKKPDSPRIWLRIDRAHIANVIKARRLLCIGEDVRGAS
jgi:hypothetical protein